MIFLLFLYDVVSIVHVCPKNTKDRHRGISEEYMFVNTCGNDAYNSTPMPIEYQFHDNVLFGKRHMYTFRNVLYGTCPFITVHVTDADLYVYNMNIDCRNNQPPIKIISLFSHSQVYFTNVIINTPILIMGRNHLHIDNVRGNGVLFQIEGGKVYGNCSNGEIIQVTRSNTESINSSCYILTQPYYASQDEKEIHYILLAALGLFLLFASLYYLASYFKKNKED